MKQVNVRKLKWLVAFIMPLLAVLSILLFVYVPVKVLNTALQKEAEEKGTEVHKIIDLELFDFI